MVDLISSTGPIGIATADAGLIVQVVIVCPPLLATAVIVIKSVPLMLSVSTVAPT